MVATSRPGQELHLAPSHGCGTHILELSPAASQRRISREGKLKQSTQNLNLDSVDIISRYNLLPHNTQPQFSLSFICSRRTAYLQLSQSFLFFLLLLLFCHYRKLIDLKISVAEQYPKLVKGFVIEPPNWISLTNVQKASH